MNTGHWWLDGLAIAGVVIVAGIPTAFGVWHLVDLWRGRSRPQHLRKEKEAADETPTPDPDGNIDPASKDMGSVAGSHPVG
jgi:hypothetical protein